MTLIRRRPAAHHRLRAWLAVVVVATAAGCSSSDDGGGAPVDPGGRAPESSEPAAAVTAPGAPAPSPPGTGIVVVGGASHPFEVTECRLEPDPDQPEGARTLVAVTGAGTTERGVAFTVEVQRFATGTEVQTFTDTVVYADSGRILQAQRIEVGGQVTDLRDPDATSALLRVRADGVSLSGLASGPGEDQEDGGLIGLALDATC